MDPQLQPGEFVFCSIPTQSEIPEGVNPVGMFRETEGRTLIVKTDDARLIPGEYSSPMRCISLAVHSSLEAVGLTAAVATELAKHNISANVVAAYYHDHIFIGSADAALALKVLKALSKSSAIG
jgi:hypothetical protein